MALRVSSCQTGFIPEQQGAKRYDTIVVYNCAWQGRAQLAIRQTTMPPVTSETNQLSTNSAFAAEWFDVYGNQIANVDLRGTQSTMTYRIETGALKQRVVDVQDHSIQYDFCSDNLGRVTEALSPVIAAVVGNSQTAQTIRPAKWTLYKDLAGEVWTASGYVSGGSKVVVNPITVQKFDRAGRETDRVSAVRPSGQAPLTAGDTAPQPKWCRWSSRQYDNEGRLATSRVYHQIPTQGVGYYPGTEYGETGYKYDAMFRRCQIIGAGGTITHVDFDKRGLPKAIKIGTDTNDLTVVETRHYDNGLSGGNGLLTQLTYNMGGASRTIGLMYDWRNRNNQLNLPDGNQATLDYTDQGKVKATGRGPKGVASVPQIKQALIDSRGRTYREIEYGLTPGTNALSGRQLVTDYWFNEADDVLMLRPPGNGAFLRNTFDQLGQCKLTEHVSELGGGPSLTVGEVIESIARQFDDVGQQILTTNSRLAQASVGNMSRVRQIANWHDSLGRLCFSADYGAGNTPRLSQRPDGVPMVEAAVGTVLLDQNTFNERGENEEYQDVAGRITHFTHDDAGRRTERIENYLWAGFAILQQQGFLTPPAYSDVNRTTQYQYTLDNQLQFVTLKNPRSGDQITQYVYGAPTAVAGLPSSQVSSSELATAVILPGNRRVEFRYGTQGEVIAKRDAGGRIHLYQHDGFGRLYRDDALPTDQILSDQDSVMYLYNDRGLIEYILNGDNNIRRQYDDFDQLASEVSQDATSGQFFEVDLQYDNTPNSYRNLTGIVYAADQSGPAGQMTLDIASDVYDRPYRLTTTNRIKNNLSRNRLASIAYRYLGLGEVYSVNCAENGTTYDLSAAAPALASLTGQGAAQPGDSFPGLDRFDRVKRCAWSLETGASTLALGYNYDVSGNTLLRSEFAATPAFHDDVLAYDRLDRTVSYQRGHSADGKGNVHRLWTGQAVVRPAVEPRRGGRLAGIRSR